MKILSIIIFFIIFVLIDYFLIKYEIKLNIDLFYDIHREEVLKCIYRAYARGQYDLSKMTERELRNLYFDVSIRLDNIDKEKVAE